MQSQNSLILDNLDIVLTTGASVGLFASLISITKPGDRVLVPDPGLSCISSNFEMLHLVGIPYNPLTPLEEISKNTGTELDVRAVLWNYSHNPTGNVPLKSIVQGTVEELEKKSIFLISRTLNL